MIKQAIIAMLRDQIANELGINTEELFIPFDTTGTVVHFESRVPTECEITHLTVILITEDSWDPTTVHMSAVKRSQEDAEMQMIHSLTSYVSKQVICDMLRDQSNSRQVSFGQVEQELTKITMVFDERTFCRRLIGAVNIVTTFCDDIDGWSNESRVQKIITNDRHSKIGPEEL